LADQEFLASFGVEIDEAGVSRLQEALEQNQALAEEVAAAFDAARQAVQAFFAELSEAALPGVGGNIAAGVSEGSKAGLSLPFSLDLSKANKELAAFVREAKKPVSLSADASAVVSAGRNALSQLQYMFASSVLTIRANIAVSGGIGDTIAGGISGVAGSLSNILNVPASTAPAVNNSSKSVQAPVSINVTTTGTDPALVGRSVYDVTEQYLLRTLNSAMG